MQRESNGNRNTKSANTTTITPTEFLLQFALYVTEMEVPKLKCSMPLKLTLDNRHFAYLYSVVNQPAIIGAQHITVADLSDDELERRVRLILKKQELQQNDTRELADFAFRYFRHLSKLKIAPIAKKTIEGYDMEDVLLDLGVFNGVTHLELSRIKPFYLINMDKFLDKLETLKLNDSELKDLNDILVRPVTEGGKRRKGKLPSSHLNDSFDDAKSLSVSQLNLSERKPAFTWKLRTLDVSRNIMTCLDSLSHVPYLTELNLSKNVMKQIPDFSELKLLKKLYLSGNFITDLSISFGTSIEFLDVSSNQISKIGELPLSLKELDISSNVLADISSFKRLSVIKLKSINIKGNKFKEGYRQARNSLYSLSEGILVDGQGRNSWLSFFTGTATNEKPVRNSAGSGSIAPLKNLDQNARSHSDSEVKSAVDRMKRNITHNVSIVKSNSEVLKRNVVISTPTTGSNSNTKTSVPSTTSTAMSRRRNEFDMVMPIYYETEKPVSIRKIKAPQMKDKIQDMKNKSGKNWLKSLSDEKGNGSMEKVGAKIEKNEPSFNSRIEENRLVDDDTLKLVDSQPITSKAESNELTPLFSGHMFPVEIYTEIVDSDSSEETARRSVLQSTDGLEPLTSSSRASVKLSKPSVKVRAEKLKETEKNIKYLKASSEDNLLFLGDEKTMFKLSDKKLMYKEDIMKETLHRDILGVPFILNVKVKWLESQETMQVITPASLIIRGDSKFKQEENRGYVMLTSKRVVLFIERPDGIHPLVSLIHSDFESVSVSFQRQNMSIGFLVENSVSNRRIQNILSKNLLERYMGEKASRTTFRYQWTLLFKDSALASEFIDPFLLYLYESSSRVKIQQNPMDFLETVIFEMLPELEIDIASNRLLALTEIIPLYLTCAYETQREKSKFLKNLGIPDSSAQGQHYRIPCSLFLLKHSLMSFELVLAYERYPTNDKSARENKFNVISRNFVARLTEMSCTKESHEYVMSFSFAPQEIIDYENTVPGLDKWAVMFPSNYGPRKLMEYLRPLAQTLQ
ncbi:hypothetical protein MP638_000400 [Amoeboaphelidium occidentale]|nr:hypothetical protein MP638_000400 [Amoeboaphelidium occidentale]